MNKGIKRVFMAALLFAVAFSAPAALENDFIYQEGVFQKEGDCWFQAFTLTGSEAKSFVLRLASDYYCDAAILSEEQLGNFTNNLSFSGAAVLTNQIGTQFATLTNGTFYVCARTRITGANRYRLELDRKIDLPADDEFSYSFYDYCMNTAVYLDAEGGVLWHGFTIEAGVRYLLDGCNSGVETYIIPASEVSAFQEGEEFEYYAAYSDPGANGWSPGLYEIDLPPGDYYFACINQTSINRAIVYTMERWIKKALPLNVTVYFDAQGGSVSPRSKTVKRGAAYGALPEPARSGYSFGGWWTEAGGMGAPVTAATIVTAPTNHTLSAFWTLIAEPTITTANPLPTATVGVPYESVRLSATGGQTPYQWALDSGALPDGLSLGEDGVVGGTPGAAGTATFTVRVTGGNNLSSTKTFSLTVEPHPILAVTPAGYTVTQDAGAVMFGVTNAAGGELTWMVSVISGSSWVGLAVSDGLVTVSYAANPSGGPRRTAVLRVTAAGATGSPAEVTLTQAENAEVPTYAATVGVAFEGDLSAIVGTAGNVSVKGLPSGLKYNAATRRIAGVPARLGEFMVQAFSAGNLLGTVRLAIAALPAWAQGTFNGTVEGGGAATMTVTAAGKISGKISLSGSNFTFGAVAYAAGGRADKGFAIETTAKAGKASLPLALAVAKAGTPVSLGVATGTLGGWGVALWSDVWKDEAARLAPHIGYYTATLAGSDAYGSGYLTFTVDKAGKVKTAGKVADGTAVSLGGTLILDASNRVFAVVYTAPAAYKGGGLFGLVEFADPGTGGKVFLRPLNAAPFVWSSLNPQATAIYGAGFARETALAGGWYAKAGDLGAYYAGKVLSAGTDTNAPAPALTVGTNRFDSVWWDPSGIVLTPTLKAGLMTGLSAPPAGKPTDADKDGAWDYSAVNAVGLKIALARPTGIFKGSFLAWFDYPEKKHVSKSLAFEGVLTPEREDPADGAAGRGFFLWADKAAIPATGKAYSFNGSYDFRVLSD